jgi:O-antigen ligase
LKGASRARKLWLTALGIFLVIGIAITYSRTGMVGIAIVLLVSILLRISRSQSVQLRLAWFSVAILVMLTIGVVAVPWASREIQKINAMPPYRILSYVEQGPLNTLLYRFSVIESEKHGLGARIAIWRSHLRLFQESPVFGWGPGKSRHDTVVDSEYVLYLRRYGVVGLAFLLLLYWQILRFSWRLLGYHQEAWRIGASIVAALLAYLAANFVIYTFYQLQLMSLFWLLVGLGYSMVYFPEGKSPQCRAVQAVSVR